MPDWPGLRDHDAGGTLVRRPAGQLAGTVESAVVSTQAVSFSGVVHTWDEMPDESVRVAWSASPLVAEGVHRSADRAVRVGGVLHQRMDGWRAYEDRVVVAHALRSLTVRSDGRLEPAGGWFHHSELVLAPAVAPERRDGTVPAGVDDDEAAPAPGTGRRRPLVPAHGRDQERAAGAFVHLPAVVRQGMVDAVPDPTVWLGELVQHASDHRPVDQVVSMLRAQGDRAVALRAWRRLPRRRWPTAAAAEEALARTDWTVCQLTYDLTGPTRAQVTA